MNKINRRQKKEIEIIFINCPENLFPVSLEIGAGDGTQSRMIKKFTKFLYSSDFNKKRLLTKEIPGIEYKICDAQKINSYFDEKQFDMIISSNLLEHIPDVKSVLSGIKSILKDEGISIHCIPNPFWKLTQLIFFYPDLIFRVIKKIIKFPFKKDNPLKKGLFYIKADALFDNNPGSQRKYSRLWPSVHGISKNIFEEFLYFRKSHWVKELEDSGFEVIRIVNGPCSLGYELKLGLLMGFLESLGFSSEYIYVIQKKGFKSIYREYFS